MFENDIPKILQELVDKITEGEVANLAIVGIRAGGEPLAHFLQKGVAEKSGQTPLLGMLDITLYRDDLDLHGGLKQPEIRATEVPFSIDGKRLLLVDDVFFTGRTVRAALDALSDLGRPSRIELLVLVDRGFHELPIKPDFIGFSVETKMDDTVNVIFDDKKGWSLAVSHGKE